jgi:hypothetical protein
MRSRGRSLASGTLFDLSSLVHVSPHVPTFTATVPIGFDGSKALLSAPLCFDICNLFPWLRTRLPPNDTTYRVGPPISRTSLRHLIPRGFPCMHRIAQKIPFTATRALEVELLLYSGRLSVSGLHTRGTSMAAIMERARCICALLFGIFFLLRKGEFPPKPTPGNNRNTQMRRSHLRFMTEDQSLIPYYAIGTTRASWLTISIEFSKADQTGRGRIITHYINVDVPLSRIVQRMEAYFYLSRTYSMAQDHDLLFHVPGLPALTTDFLTSCLRQTCHLLGLPCDKVSAHSLRYGGAATLAAAVFPEYIIAFYCGWAQGSSAMRRYIKPSNDIIKRVSSHMTRPQSPRAVQAVVNQLLTHRFHDSGASES